MIHHSNFQKRAPKGHPAGGQWADEGKLLSAAKEAAGVSDLDMFEHYASQWLGGIDPDARDSAFQMARANPDLLKYLIKETFGENPPKVTTLYRVGGLGDIYEGKVVSLFSSLGAAEAYQKRFGVDSISSFEVPTMATVPSGPGSNEVWVEIDDLL